MGWQNIGEGIIASIIGTLITNLISQNYKKRSGEKIKLNFPKDPFLISLSITVFFGILSLFGFYYNWEKFSYLVIITIFFGFLSALILNKQCPKCKRIFTKHTTNKETLKEEKRPWYYRDLTIYLYTDGTEKNREYSKHEKKRMETWRIEKEHYQCEKCGHKWKRVFERNLDEHTRPKIQKTVMTKYRDPNLDDF